jgi:hypothetical protein
MIETAIASFPSDKCLTVLYQVAIALVDAALGKGSFDPSTMRLWYFISKDYSQIQQLDQKMIQLFTVRPLI